MSYKPTMENNSQQRRTRGSYGGRAPSLSASQQPRRRKRRKRGRRKKKRRAGARKSQTKSQRIAKVYLRTMYWNCGSLNERGLVCEKLTYDHDIVCIQETKLGQFKNYNVTGFKTHYNRNGHGQVILVRDTIQHSVIDVSRWASENLHIQAIKLDNQPVSNIVNIYACNRVVTEQEWEKLGDIERTLPGTTLICGDFNARGADWGNTVTNLQGTALENALDVCDIQCLNDGSMTRRAMRANDSDGAIDLAFASLQVADKCQWKVLGFQDNDHAPCSTRVRRRDINQQTRHSQAFKYTPVKDNPVGLLRINARPAKAPRKQDRTQPPWWTEEIDDLWSTKRAALKRLCRNLRNPVLREEEKSASKAFQIAAEESKSARYEEFCHGVTEDNTLYKFWQFHRAMNNKKKIKGIPDFETEDKVWVRNDEDKGKALFSRYLRQTNQNNEDERRALDMT